MPNIGDKICNRYKLSEPLGQGAFAQVWKAIDESTKQTVALKIFASYQNDIEQVKIDVQTEVLAVERLNHSSIIIPKHYDFDEEKQLPFFVMDYADSGDLVRYFTRLFLKKEIVPEHVVRWIIDDISLGLDYIHREGIVHKDIKSDNIMIKSGERRDKFVLIDFGISQRVNRFSRERKYNKYPNQIINNDGERMTNKQQGSDNGRGPAAYLSPEQARNQRVSTKSDIFSFGVVLYEITQAQLPWAGQGGFGANSLKGLPEFPNEDKYTPELINLIKSCLQLDPDKRPSAHQLSTGKISEINQETKQVNEDALETYKKLFEVFFEDCNISESERKLLDERKFNLNLTDEIVNEIEKEIRHNKKFKCKNYPIKIASVAASLLFVLGGIWLFNYISNKSEKEEFNEYYGKAIKLYNTRKIENLDSAISYFEKSKILNEEEYKRTFFDDREMYYQNDGNLIDDWIQGTKLLKSRLLIEKNKGQINEFNNSFATFKDSNNRYGIIDKMGVEVLKPKYDTLTNFQRIYRQYMALYKYQGFFGLIDINFQEVIELEKMYTNVHLTSGDTLIAELGKDTYRIFFDNNGKIQEEELFSNYETDYWDLTGKFCWAKSKSDLEWTLYKLDNNRESKVLSNQKASFKNPIDKNGWTIVQIDFQDYNPTKNDSIIRSDEVNSINVPRKSKVKSEKVYTETYLFNVYTRVSKKIDIEWVSTVRLINYDKNKNQIGLFWSVESSPKGEKTKFYLLDTNGRHYSYKNMEFKNYSSTSSNLFKFNLSNSNNIVIDYNFIKKGSEYRNISGFEGDYAIAKESTGRWVIVDKNYNVKDSDNENITYSGGFYFLWNRSRFVRASDWRFFYGPDFTYYPTLVRNGYVKVKKSDSRYMFFHIERQSYFNNREEFSDWESNNSYYRGKRISNNQWIEIR